MKKTFIFKKDWHGDFAHSGTEIEFCQRGLEEFLGRNLDNENKLRIIIGEGPNTALLSKRFPYVNGKYISLGAGSAINLKYLVKKIVGGVSTKFAIHKYNG
jgi:hypothetical protein